MATGRESFPDLFRAIDRIEWRVDELDKWREKIVDGKLHDLSNRVQAMSRADDIANAVTERMHKDAKFGFSTAQKVGALVVGLVLLADGIKGLIT